MACVISKRFGSEKRYLAECCKDDVSNKITIEWTTNWLYAMKFILHLDAIKCRDHFKLKDVEIE